MIGRCLNLELSLVTLIWWWQRKRREGMYHLGMENVWSCCHLYLWLGRRMRVFRDPSTRGVIIGRVVLGYGSD